MLVNIIDGRPEGYISIDECAKKNNVSRCLVMKRIKENRVDRFYISYPGGRLVTWVKDDTVIKKEYATKRKNLNFFSTEYPYNLIHTVYGENYQWDGSEDQLAGLEYALSTLTEKEQMIINERFVKKLIYDDIGKLHGVGRERIRQILMKAYRKLRNPTRCKYIRDGLNAEKEREKQTFRDDKIDQYGCSEAFYNLSFSVRTFNCLRRANIGTVKDVVTAWKKLRRKLKNIMARILKKLWRKSYEF